MAIYHVDIRDGERWHRDAFGDDLPGFIEARDQAICILPQMAREAGSSEDHHQVTCRVRGAADGVVYEGELTFNGRSIERDQA